MSNQTNRQPPIKEEPSNSLLNIYVKLLGFDLNSLTPSPHDPNSFHRKGVPISGVETLGIVVTRDFKPNKFLKFSIDDGTSCIQCILWLNHFTSPYFSRRCASDVHALAQVAQMRSSLVHLGVSARVRGRLTRFRGSVQITVEDVVLESDPNYDILHWLDCINLARKHYDVVSSKK